MAAELFAKYNCTNCQDDIPGIRVHCAECDSFDLCLQCFAAGAEIGKHRNDHSYQFMDTGTGILSIFRGKGSWSAQEELRLLNSIEKYGFGNWEDISKHIETRSADDAREEYVTKYLSGTIGRHTWTPASESQGPNLIDHTEEDNGPLGSNSVQRLPPLDVTAEEAAQLGYMPNRDGFEPEYDPTAEQLISNLTLNPDDEEIDLLLKLAQIDIYTRRLRERARRKRLVRDYQLVSNFFRGTIKPSRLTRDQRDFRDRFRVFAQFYTAHEYDRLTASLERERDLRIRLSELNRYRWNGLTRIDECVHFEQHAAASQSRNTGPYGHGRTDNQTIGNRHGSYSHSQHKKTEIGNGNERNSNFIGQKHMHHTGDQTYSDVLSPNKNCLDNCRGSSGQLNQQLTPTTITPTTTTTTQLNYLNQQQQKQQIQNTNGNIAVGNGRQQIQQKQQQQQQNPQQQQQQLQEKVGNLTHQQQQQITQSVNGHAGNYPQNQQLQPGENLLSTNEIQLCTSLNLPPTRYITLKTVLLSGAPLSTTTLSPSSLSSVENSIREYLIRAGWLSH